MKRNSLRAKLARAIIRNTETHPNWFQRWGLALILLSYKRGMPIRSMYLPGLTNGKIKE